MRTAILAAALAIGLAGACGGEEDGLEIPGAPTSPNADAQPFAEDAPTAAAGAPVFGPVDTARGVSRDARYSWSNTYYRQLVYDEYDRGEDWGRAFMLRDPASIRINVFRGDVDGRCSVGSTVRDLNGRSIDYRRIIRNSARRLIEDATGQPWRGRVYGTARSGLAAQIANDPGYVTVGFVSDGRSHCGGGRDVVGCAQVGTRPGGIKLMLDSSCRVRVYNQHQFGFMFAHELGHSLGFYHVSATSWTMTRRIPASAAGATYGGREAQHMALASRHARERRLPYGPGIEAPKPMGYGGRGVSIFDPGGVWID